MIEIDRGIYAALTGDTVLMALINSVHHEVAPATATWPFVLFRQQEGYEVNSLGGRVGKNLTYQVKAVTREGETQTVAASIDNRIRVVLDRQTLSLTGWRSVDVRRESDINYREVDEDGFVWQYVGGMYSIVVAPT